MSTGIDEARIDDPGAIGELDASGMLRAVATSAAQIRESWASVHDAGIAQLADEGRPRSIVVCGMGGSGIAGDVLVAALGSSVSVPIVVHRNAGIPGWVGAADLVIGVSCSGSTRETLAAVDEARHRAARLIGVGAPDSQLAEVVGRGRGVFVPARQVLAPRASLWALATPLLAVAATYGLIDIGDTASVDELPVTLELAAARLEQIAIGCRPDSESFLNPAKEIALAIADALPIVWGSGQCGPVAALRFSCQLAENAKVPAVWGALPEAHHNQVVSLDGLDDDTDDIFRDRVDDLGSTRPRIVLIRDDADPASMELSDSTQRLADSRGLPVTVAAAEGESAIERLASVIGLLDFASVYIAVLRGVDPTPIRAIAQLKG